MEVAIQGAGRGAARAEAKAAALMAAADQREVEATVGEEKEVARAVAEKAGVRSVARMVATTEEAAKASAACTDLGRIHHA